MQKSEGRNTISGNLWQPFKHPSLTPPISSTLQILGRWKWPAKRHSRGPALTRPREASASASDPKSTNQGDEAGEIPLRTEAWRQIPPRKNAHSQCDATETRGGCLRRRHQHSRKIGARGATGVWRTQRLRSSHILGRSEISRLPPLSATGHVTICLATVASQMRGNFDFMNGITQNRVSTPATFPFVSKRAVFTILIGFRFPLGLM